MTATNPNALFDLTFPYPQMGSVVRPVGQGCLSCVHKTYCPAIYWLRLRNTEHGFDKITDHHGLKCASWSNNEADIVTTVTEQDTDAVQYRDTQWGGAEPDRCPIGTTTGNSRM